MQGFVGVDCKGQIVSGDGGFDDGVDGDGGDDLVGLLELLECVEGFRGQLRRLSEVEVQRPDSRVCWRDISCFHDGEDREGGAVVSGCEVGFEECFVMMNSQTVCTLTKDAEDVSCKTEITIASGRIQDIDTHSGRRVQVPCFNAITPRVKGRFVMMAATSSVKDVVPQSRRYLKLRIVLSIAHEHEHLVEVSGVTEAICKEVIEPGVYAY